MRSKRTLTPNWYPVAIVAAAVLAYAGSMHGPPVFDDLLSIAQNPTLRHFSTALSPPTGGLTVSGRPILNLSFAVNYAISGTAAWSYHALNLLIHTLAALLLFGLLRRTPPKSAPFAFAVALLWAVHPIQSESVTYLVQRAESLMGLFYIATLYGFSKASTDEAVHEKTRRWWLAFSCLACLMGMGTKEVMVTAPVLVLFYDRTFVSGSFSAALARRRVYYLLLASTWLWCGFLVAGVHGRGGTAGFAAGMSWQQYGLTQFRAIEHYLRLSIWPHPLIFDYGPVFGGETRQLTMDAVLVLGLAAIAIFLFVSRRPLGFAGVAFFVLLLPSSSVVPIPTETIAEHRMYLPLAASLAALVGGISVVREKFASRLTIFHNYDIYTNHFHPLAFVVCLIAAAVLVVATFRRNAVYQSAVSLWADTVAKAPENARARNNFGFALAESGDPVEAETQFRAALAEAPDFASAHVNLGNALAKQGRLPEAVENYRAALRLVPQDAAVHEDLGTALLRQRRTDEARTEFTEALRLDPKSAVGHFDLGCALEQAGQIPPAIAEYKQAIALDSDYWDAWYNFGNILAREGRFSEAAKAFASAVKIRPGVVDARVNYGNVLTELGRLPEAIQEFQAAVGLQPSAADVHDALADLLVRTGQWPAARAEYETASGLNPNDRAAQRGLENLARRSQREP